MASFSLVLSFHPIRRLVRMAETPPTPRAPRTPGAQVPPTISTHRAAFTQQARIFPGAETPPTPPPTSATRRAPDSHNVFAPWRPRIVAYVICKYWLQVVWNDVSLKRSILTNVAHGVTHSFPNDRGWFAFIGDQEVCVISPAGSGMLTYLRLSESCVGMSFFIASLWRSRLESATSCIRHGAMRRANMDRTYFVMIKRYRRISEVKEDLSLLTNIDSEGPIQICALRDQGTQTEMYRPP